jgi:hypothetical protein
MTQALLHSKYVTASDEIALATTESIGRIVNYEDASIRITSSLLKWFGSSSGSSPGRCIVEVSRFFGDHRARAWDRE